MAEKMERCAIYIRVSTAEQMMHGKSLEAQKECLENYAKEHNMIVSGVYADEGKTARKELKKRKAIHDLLNDVRSGKIDVILFWRLDRWFRNLSDFYKVQDILDECGVHWISVSEPGINMETRDGRLQLNVVLSIGQNEVDTTSERIKFVNESSIRQGKLIFGDANMPLGYKSGIVDGKKRMVKDPDTAPIVEDIFNFFRIHQGKRETLRYVKDTYGIDFSYSMLRTMLCSEFYKGTYRGIPYCPPYLSEDEWNEIREISKRNVKAAPSGRIYIFSGLIICPECGRKLCGTGGKSIVRRSTGEKRIYLYYRCNRAVMNNMCSNRKSVNQKTLEEYIVNNISEEFQKYNLYCQDIIEKEKKEKKVRSRSVIQKEMDRLNLMFQKDRIKWDYYNEEYSKLEHELQSVDVIQPIAHRSFEKMRKIIDMDNFKEMYYSLTPENRRAFWKSTIQSICLNHDLTVQRIDFL